MKKRLNALRQRLADLRAEHERVLSTGADDAPLTAEQRTQLDALEADIKGVGQDVERLEAAIAAASAGPSEVPSIQVGPPNIQRDPLRGFRDTADFALAVHHAGHPMAAGIDQRLIEGGLLRNRGAFQAAPPAGGYHQESGTPEGAMVPPAISQAIWQLVFTDPILDQLTVEPTSSNSVEMLADETTPWGASGIVAKWRAEGVQMDPSKLDTKTKQVKLHELYAFVLATSELLEDAPRLNDRLNVKAPAAIRWKFVEALMFGTGAGQPLGWAVDNYVGKVSQARTTAAQLKPDDLVKMFSRLLVQDGSDRSFWVTNRDTLPDLVLRSVIGNVPVWMPPNGLAGSPNGSILGRPLFFSEHAQTLGSAGDIQLVNPDGYYATQRGPARQDSSMHLYFDYAIEAFRWMFRFGGQPMLSAPVAAAKGANTKSHFVILAA
jgi:HK97 family phage major capsid protein